MFNRTLSNVQAVSSTFSCAKITSFVSAAIVTVAKVGSTLWAIRATQNFITGEEESGLLDYPESMVAAVLACAAVTTSNAVTKFLLMQYATTSSSTRISTTQAIPTLCNPGIDDQCHGGYMLLKGINIVYGGYIGINSVQSASSYYSGNNIGANALIGVLGSANLRAFSIGTLPQSMSAYNNLIVNRGFCSLSPGALFISFVNAVSFGINVFFTTKKSIVTFQENTLAYITDKTLAFEGLTVIASILASCALISACFNTSNARFKNKQTNLEELLVKAKSRQLKKYNIAIISSIIVSDLAFAIMIATSTAQFPKTLHDSYKDFTYTPWMLSTGAFFGLINFITSVEMDMRSYAFTLEKIIEASSVNAINSDSTQDASLLRNIPLSATPHSFFSELRQKLVNQDTLTIDTTHDPIKQDDHEEVELDEVMNNSPYSDDLTSTESGESSYMPMRLGSP